MKKDYCVYMHICPNNKRYIGITCCKPVNRRWQNGYGYRYNDHFFRAILKYGWENIQHIILEDNLSSEDAGTKEQEYIQKYKTDIREYGYNLTQGGEVGLHLSEKHKAKISKANSGENNGMYGHRYTDEERKAMSINSVWRGRKHTEETKKKISEYALAHPEKYSRKGKANPNYGKHPSEETRRKQSESAKKRGCCIPKETLKRMAQEHTKAVYQYTLDGELIRKYDSTKEAALSVGLKQSNGICASANNNPHHKTAGGYIWRYEPI